MLYGAVYNGICWMQVYTLINTEIAAGFSFIGSEQPWADFHTASTLQYFYCSLFPARLRHAAYFPVSGVSADFMWAWSLWRKCKCDPTEAKSPPASYITRLLFKTKFLIVSHLRSSTWLLQ